MKRIKFTLPVLICLIFVVIGCSNSTSETKATSDTAVKKDTIDRNPESFSNPH